MWQQAHRRCSLGQPKLKPPVVNSTPDGLKGTTLFSLLSDGCSEPGIDGAVKGQFFCGVKSDPVPVLGNVDNRLNEFDVRNRDSARACLNDPLKDYNVTLPGGDEQTFKFSCREAMGGGTNLIVYFGFDNDYFYLAEVQQNPKIAVLSKSPKNGGAVQAWMYGHSEAEGHLTLLNIYANESDNNLFLWSYGEEGSDHDLWQGVFMGSDGEFLYVDGTHYDPFEQEYVAENVCLLAADLRDDGVAGDACDGIGSNEILAKPLQADIADHKVIVDGIFSFTGFPSGLRDFNEQ